MNAPTGKRTARLSMTLSKRNVEALELADKPYIAWDDKLMGFGIRVQPTGLKSFLVNYRAGDGGRKAPNKRVVIGRYGRVAPDQARRLARKMLGKVADGEDPAGDRASARRMPTLGEAFRDYLKAKPRHSMRTGMAYRRAVEHYLADWVSRPLDSIERREVEERFILLTENHGWALANQAISLLRSIYRRPCVDHAGLRNPVDLWLAAGGRFNPVVRRRISSPSEVLPCWRWGIEAAVTDPAIRDIFWIGMYSGGRHRLGETVLDQRPAPAFQQAGAHARPLAALRPHRDVERAFEFEARFQQIGHGAKTIHPRLTPEHQRGECTPPEDAQAERPHHRAASATTLMLADASCSVPAPLSSASNGSTAPSATSFQIFPPIDPPPISWRQ